MPDWSNFVAIGTAQSKVLEPSFDFTLGSTGAAAGALLLIIVGADNLETADTEDGADIVSVTDSKGNTYARAKTLTNGEGLAGAGVTVGIYYAKLATEILTGDVITVLFSADVRAKAMSIGRVELEAGKNVAIAGTAVLADDGTDPEDISLSGLMSRDYLFVHAIAREGIFTGLTADPDYDAFTSTSTSGGAGNTNAAIAGGVRILTGTGDTVETTWAAADYAQAFVALYLEDSEPPEPPEPSSPLTFTVRSESVKRFPLGVA